MPDEEDSDSSDEEVFDIQLDDVRTRDGAILLGGLSLIQMEALQYGDVEFVKDASELLGQLVEDNPVFARETLLSNQESFRGEMPDDILDKLDLDTRDGKFIDVSDDGDWVDVNVE